MTFPFFINFGKFLEFDRERKRLQRLLGGYSLDRRKVILQDRLLVWRQCAYRHHKLYISSARLSSRRKLVPLYFFGRYALKKIAFSFFRRRNRMYYAKYKRNLKKLSHSFLPLSTVRSFRRFYLKKASLLLSGSKSRRNKKNKIDDGDIEPMPWW